MKPLKYKVTSIQTTIIINEIDKQPIYIIYGLYDNNFNIKYVGSTSNTLLTRIKQHRIDARKGKTELHKWIQSMNYKPVVKIISYAESNLQMLLVEQYYIHNNVNLLNIKGNK